MGGFAGESKMNILQQIPKEYIPNSYLVENKQGLVFKELLKHLKAEDICFPCIAKPNVGERGLAVKICNTKQELNSYFQNAKTDFIIQNFSSYDLELAILYYKLPGQQKGSISSLCQKEFLSVTGNGFSSIKDLIKQNERAYLQLERFEKEKAAFLDTVLKKEETKVIEYIGNHNKGTTFLDKNHLIDKELEDAFDKLAEQIPDLNFGRFDLKCQSLEELKKLENFSILEINGVSAEPAHIYAPGYSFWKAQRTLLNQWNVLYQIAKIQIEKGEKPMSFSSAKSHIKQYRKTIALQSK